MSGQEDSEFVSIIIILHFPRVVRSTLQALTAVEMVLRRAGGDAVVAENVAFDVVFLWHRRVLHCLIK